MNANELADIVDHWAYKESAEYLTDAANMLRQQQNEIEDLKNANRFIQNFAEEQHQRAVALESELDRAVELYTDKAIENEALKQIIDANNLNQNIGQFVKPTNEPVAWMLTLPDGTHDWILDGNGCEGYIPLYTHPVKELKNIVLASATCSCGKVMEVTNLQPVKDLEDIDINITWNENSMRDFGKDELAFARAILRKAQE